MLRGDQARKDPQAPLGNGEIMVAAAKRDATHLDHAEPAALGTIFDRKLLQHDDAMRNRVKLQVILRRRQIVEQDDRTFALGEEVLQGENLTAVAQRAL